MVSIGTNFLTNETHHVKIKEKTMQGKESSKITSYTREEVAKILGTIKDCVRNGRYEILKDSNTRNDNKEFIETFGLDSEQQKSILLGIEVDDFCYGLHNAKKGYEHEILYVFYPHIELFAYEANIVIGVYTKFNILNERRVVVVSFHDKHKPITHLFN
jgi:hypothetical protein